MGYLLWYLWGPRTIAVVVVRPSNKKFPYAVIMRVCVSYGRLGHPRFSHKYLTNCFTYLPPPPQAIFREKQGSAQVLTSL